MAKVGKAANRSKKTKNGRGQGRTSGIRENTGENIEFKDIKNKVTTRNETPLDSGNKKGKNWGRIPGPGFRNKLVAGVLFSNRSGPFWGNISANFVENTRLFERKAQNGVIMAIRDFFLGNDPTIDHGKRRPAKRLMGRNPE